jgi:hypothetical protein
MYLLAIREIRFAIEHVLVDLVRLIEGNGMPVTGSKS